MLVNPLLSAYFKPKIMARYSAALFVATPKPSRSLHVCLPSSARSTTPAPACPGFPFEAPSNSRVQERPDDNAWSPLCSDFTCFR
nr:hypothetical protein Iba_chr08eCG11570 [Ipomoea batatas]